MLERWSPPAVLVTPSSAGCGCTVLVQTSQRSPDVESTKALRTVMDELVLAPPAGMAMGSVSTDDDVILITYILQMISIDTGGGCV